jgi:hypothetical protein
MPCPGNNALVNRRDILFSRTTRQQRSIQLLHTCQHPGQRLGQVGVDWEEKTTHEPLYKVDEAWIFSFLLAACRGPTFWPSIIRELCMALFVAAPKCLGAFSRRRPRVCGRTGRHGPNGTKPWCCPPRFSRGPPCQRHLQSSP